MQVWRRGRELHRISTQRGDDRRCPRRVCTEYLKGRRVRVDGENNVRSGFKRAAREPAEASKEVTHTHLESHDTVEYGHTMHTSREAQM